MSDPQSTGSLGQDRLNGIIAAYLEAVEAGKAPDREEWLDRHPDFANELRAFFADHDKMKALAEPVAEAPAPDAGVEEPTLPPRQAAPGEEAVEAATLPPSGALRGDSATSPPREAAGTRRHSAPPVGTKVRYFGDYELLQEIARGGMGVVYKARQLKLNRVVAIKMILAGQLASQEDVQRFYTEAEAAAGLDHPGIVPIYEVGEHEGQHYFSMGFVDGDSLSGRIAEQPLPPRDAATLLHKVADAVRYAHDQGVIHRDLKPANILLDRSDEPKITDFGLAKQIRTESGMTASGQILGTPSYMPPEQAAGRLNEVRETESCGCQPDSPGYLFACGRDNPSPGHGPR